MDISIRVLTRIVIQSFLCFLCFNLGYFFAFQNSLDSSASSNPLGQNSGEKQLVSNGDNVLLVIIIVSHPKNSERRQAIRDTWLKLSRKTRPKVKHFFAVGTRNILSDTSRQVEEEQQANKDLLELSIDESYSQLTDKVISVFKYLNENERFHYLLKVDDDTFVRVSAVVDELENANFREKFYWGFFDGRAPVIRNPKSKWKEDEYALCDRYIPYALGGGYVLSRDLVAFISDNSNILHRFKSEDVSVGTWLAPLKINRIHDVRFNTEAKSRGCFNKYIVLHKQSVEEMKSLQYNLDSQGVLCGTEFRHRLSYQYNWNVPPSQCCQRGDPSIP